MAAPGGLIKFYISIRNNGSEPDSFTIMVSGPTAAGFSIRYFHGVHRISGAMVARTYATPALAPGQTYQISAIVRLPGVPPHHSIGW